MKTTKSRFKTIDLVEVALFTAIIIVLAFTPLGYIPLGAINATTIHIPVILAGIVMGWKKGGILGFVFGVTSFLNASFFKPNITSFLFSPLYPGGNIRSLVICFIPRILIGVVAYLTFKVAYRIFRNETVTLAFAGMCGSLTNTVLVMSGAYVFFAEPYAEAIGKNVDIVGKAMLAVVFGNGIPEAVCAGILTAGIGKALLIYKRRRG